MTETLKPLPCPLCGRDVEEFVETEDRIEALVGGHALRVSSERTFFGVRCKHCDLAQTNPFSVRFDAITAWNTRPREAELEAEVERLREGVRRALTYMDPMSPGHSSHKMADARRVLQTAISHPKGADE